MRYRHKKRGSTYTLVGRAKIQAPKDAPLTDYEVVQIYQSEATNEMYVRRVSEFNDGRFELIEPSPKAGSTINFEGPFEYMPDGFAPLVPTKDEAIEAALDIFYGGRNAWANWHPKSEIEIRKTKMKSIMHAAITAYDLARFGGDPGEKISDLEEEVGYAEERANERGCRLSELEATLAELQRNTAARIAELETAHRRIVANIWSNDPNVLGMIIEEMRATSRAALQKGSEG